MNILEEGEGGVMEVEELSEDESLSEIEEEIDDIEEDEENDDDHANGVKEVVDEQDDEESVSARHLTTESPKAVLQHQTHKNKNVFPIKLGL